MLNEIEMQTGGKRLEQTVNFSSTIVSTILGVITGILTPIILLRVCGYEQGSDFQSESTKIKLVFFYTLFTGIFYCLSLLPLIGYKLNKKRREEINAALGVMRAERIAKEQDNSSLLSSETWGDPVERGFEDMAENIAQEIVEDSEESSNSEKED